MDTCKVDIPCVGFIVMGCIVAISTGCDSKASGYVTTVRSARHTIPEAVQVEQLFGSNAVDHFITHYGASAQVPVVWNTQVFVGERYKLSMEVPIDIDYDLKSLTPTSPVTFWLVEVIAVSELGDGRVEARFGTTTKIGPDRWKQVVENSGDFAAAGFALNAERVKGFASYVQAIRRDRAKDHIALIE